MSHSPSILRALRQNTRYTETHLVDLVDITLPSHSAQTAQLGGLEKISPTMIKQSIQQLYPQLWPHPSHKSKTLAVLFEFAPLASPVESSEIMATYSARPSNIVRHDGSLRQHRHLPESLRYQDNIQSNRTPSKQLHLPPSFLDT